MTYTLYIYKTTAYHEDAPVVSLINHALGSFEKEDWIDAERCMEEINMHIFVSMADKLISKNTDGTDKYKIHTCYTPIKKREYIAIFTSFEIVEDIIDDLKYIAAKCHCVLFDSVIKECYFPYKAKRQWYVKASLRAKQLAKRIRDEEAIYKIVQLENCFSQISYAISICKTEKSLEERVQNFWNLLEKEILPDESLVCRDKCFSVVGEKYQISFVYEGYRYNSDSVGYIENGKPKIELTHRMGIMMARNCTNNLKCKNNQKFMNDMMRIEELVNMYPNPADRYVAIYKIRKKLQKYDSYVSYDCYPCYGGDVRLHKVYENGFYGDVCCSYLKVDENFACIFTPCILEFYPYFSERYFLTTNFLPDVMCLNIIEESKKIKKMLATNPYSDESQMYLKNNGCMWMLDNMKDFWRAIGIFDIFIKWMEAQFSDDYDDREFSIDITGP